MSDREEKKLWILNDEGLYNAWQRSGLSMDAFIKKMGSEVEEVIENVTSGAKPAHYLAYPPPDSRCVNHTRKQGQ